MLEVNDRSEQVFLYAPPEGAPMQDRTNRVAGVILITLGAAFLAASSTITFVAIPLVVLIATPTLLIAIGIFFCLKKSPYDIYMEKRKNLIEEIKRNPTLDSSTFGELITRAEHNKLISKHIATLSLKEFKNQYGLDFIKLLDSENERILKTRVIHDLAHKDTDPETLKDREEVKLLKINTYNVINQIYAIWEKLPIDELMKTPFALNPLQIFENKIVEETAHMLVIQIAHKYPILFERRVLTRSSKTIEERIEAELKAFCTFESFITCGYEKLLKLGVLFTNNAQFRKIVLAYIAENPLVFLQTDKIPILWVLSETNLIIAKTDYSKLVKNAEERKNKLLAEVPEVEPFDYTPIYKEILEPIYTPLNETKKRLTQLTSAESRAQEEINLENLKKELESAKTLYNQKFNELRLDHEEKVKAYEARCQEIQEQEKDQLNKEILSLLDSVVKAARM